VRSVSAPGVELAGRQLARLTALAERWKRDLPDDDAALLPGAMRTFAADRAALERDAERYGEELVCDDRAMASDGIAATFRRADALEGIRYRLDDFFRRKPDVEQSEELDYLQDEFRLMRTLGLHIDSVGTPRFDGLLAEWEQLDQTRVYHYGLDQGLGTTLARLVPVAEAYLALAAGTVDPSTYLVAAAPPPEEISGGPRP
jgi:hypothetical protein